MEIPIRLIQWLNNKLVELNLTNNYLCPNFYPNLWTSNKAFVVNDKRTTQRRFSCKRQLFLQPFIYQTTRYYLPANLRQNYKPSTKLITVSKAFFSIFSLYIKQKWLIWAVFCFNFIGKSWLLFEKHCFFSEKEHIFFWTCILSFWETLQRNRRKLPFFEVPFTFFGREPTFLKNKPSCFAEKPSCFWKRTPSFWFY